jgi:hypothetical protein
MEVGAGAVHDRLLEVDEVREAAVRERDALRLLLALDLELLVRDDVLLRGGLLVGDREVGSAVEDGVEELGEGVLLQDAWRRRRQPITRGI